MSTDVRSDLIQGTDTCQECPAPITQPLGRGRRKVFCAACLARREAQAKREWRAARSSWPTTCQDCAAPITQIGTGCPRSRCASCVARRKTQATRDWYAARTDEQIASQAQDARERALQKNYGIGLVERDALLATQGGRCAICGTDEPNGHGWHVDHDHETGAVRGILCSGCNTGIGLLRDDPAALRTAAAYIESHARRTS